ncbi:uncharacterized protein L969DRAFT_378868 [Mixia osmundae IAM 14324]|uniref:t-SNARE coiled-coil homology domain-containing protein n=1 Tax=Mixia osmundae (strain CBS 9802 / IAM 14324 / JCM 22182 / KY 12970) TaxID=764103 RepID=G7E954_MIXOS|nr:uncharacterized protein L969DRAFT_378868 [Mixia osmundae IAM 14324]KEI39793.1 hypothetical protein L969DRAFT_378868 [Mixia osmundae IAM 14324]GAA99173.1 hypothetical protein E5Q_05865 [Mixia osmundae IAM 14324]
MSFNDLERGQTGQRSTNNFSHDDDSETSNAFRSLANKLSLQIFKITSNVTGINKLVELLGSTRDTSDLRTKLHDLTEVTRDLVKGSTDELKLLTSWTPESRHQKLEQAKISRDFQSAMLSFQRIQRASAEKQRQFVDRARAVASERTVAAQEDEYRDENDRTSVELQTQRLVTQQAIPESELGFQEALIEEREGEIREIESGIHELNEIFRDLGTIVHEQQSMIDNIESNVISIANSTEGASEELVQAHQYQRNAGRRKLCLLVIFIVVVAIVLLAILS